MKNSLKIYTLTGLLLQSSAFVMADSTENTKWFMWNIATPFAAGAATIGIPEYLHKQNQESDETKTAKKELNNKIREEGSKIGATVPSSNDTLIDNLDKTKFYQVIPAEDKKSAKFFEATVTPKAQNLNAVIAASIERANLNERGTLHLAGTGLVAASAIGVCNKDTISINNGKVVFDYTKANWWQTGSYVAGAVFGYIIPRMQYENGEFKVKFN